MDILTAKRGIIVHQVNLKGVMGAGLAKQIRDRWPFVYDYYKDALTSGLLKLGDVFFVEVGPDLYVANLAGQEDYGRQPGVRHTNYAALYAGLMVIHDQGKKLGLPVYIPKGMGCGLGGGDWRIVSQAIKDVIPEATVCDLEEK